MSNFQFTNPKTGQVVKFTANVPKPAPQIPVGGYNPEQVAKRATKRKAVKRKKK